MRYVVFVNWFCRRLYPSDSLAEATLYARSIGGEVYDFWACKSLWRYNREGDR